MDNDTIISYYGKNIEDMTKKELITAVKNLYRMYKDTENRLLAQGKRRFSKPTGEG